MFIEVYFFRSSGNILVQTSVWFCKHWHYLKDRDGVHMSYTSPSNQNCKSVWQPYHILLTSDAGQSGCSVQE